MANLGANLSSKLAYVLKLQSSDSSLMSNLRSVVQDGNISDQPYIEFQASDSARKYRLNFECLTCKHIVAIHTDLATHKHPDDPANEITSSEKEVTTKLTAALVKKIDEITQTPHTFLFGDKTFICPDSRLTFKIKALCCTCNQVVSLHLFMNVHKCYEDSDSDATPRNVHSLPYTNETSNSQKVPSAHQIHDLLKPCARKWIKLAKALGMKSELILSIMKSDSQASIESQLLVMLQKWLTINTTTHPKDSQQLYQQLIDALKSLDELQIAQSIALQSLF